MAVLEDLQERGRELLDALEARLELVLLDLEQRAQPVQLVGVAAGGGPMNDAGIGRMKDLSGSWTTVGCTNMSASRLAQRLAAKPIAYP